MSKFGSDSYHGSGSHAVLLRNVATGRNRWTHAVYRTAIQIDRRNTFFTLIGNVLGEAGKPATYEYVTNSGWPASASAIFRLGFPNVGNQGFSGTYPPTPLLHGDGGPRDLNVDRNNTPNGTTIIEGNWTSVKGSQDWTIAPTAIPSSLYLASKPGWFGNLPWPPIDPEHPKTDDPTIIPAGYRYVHGTEVPGVDEDGDGLSDHWEIQYFGSISDPHAIPDADADGDGLDNLAEQAAGSSPVDPSDRLAIVDQRFITTNEFQLQWKSVADRVYEIQISANLISWDVLTNLAATSSKSIWIDTTASMVGERFYRVSAQ